MTAAGGSKTHRRKASRRTLGALALALGFLSTGIAPAAAFHGDDGPHFQDGPGSNANVAFWDRSGAEWPVGTAISRWNTDNGSAELAMYWQTTSCMTSTYHCVRVDDYTNTTAPDDECVGMYGCAIRPVVPGTNHYESNGVTVWLNDSVATTAAQFRKTACHELGHSVGLEHRFVNASCMRQGASPPVSQYPETSSDPTVHDDTAGLEEAYDHDN